MTGCLEFLNLITLLSSPWSPFISETHWGTCIVDEDSMPTFSLSSDTLHLLVSDYKNKIKN